MQGSLIAHTESRPKCCNSTHGVSYDQASTSKVNLNQAERVLCGLAGALLVKRNLGRFSLSGVAKLFAGGALLRRGITGHCAMYEAMHFSSARGSGQTSPGASQRAIPIKRELNVQVPPLEAYQLWRDPANQGWIMSHFADVESLSLDRARWKMRGPMALEWDALIVADTPGEFISWESLPGAGLPNEGTVRFMENETGGTKLIFEARFDPPAGPLRMGLMKLIGVTPESILEKGLLRFKSLAEMGESRPRMKSPLKGRQQNIPVGV